MSEGFLLSLPTESIAIRAIVATLAAVLLARLLLRAGLRVPRLRAATAMVPAVVLAVVVVLCWGSLRVPALMLPVEAVDALPIPVRNGYLHFAPIAAPLLAGGWALVAVAQILRRLHSVHATRRVLARAETNDVPAAVQRIVRRLAVQLHVSPPPVALTADVAGGATVVGVARPVIVIDEQLAHVLDRRELEGVLAHELAHVIRRDNLVALLVGAVRDLTFFVPGGSWALRQLHRERELAADQAAIRMTGRPASLASGLLKVVEGPSPAAVASLAPTGTLVERVRYLVDERSATGRMRSGAEIVAVATVAVLAVGAAMEVPSRMAGPAGQRDAMAVVWSGAAEAADADSSGEPRAFDVYRRSSLRAEEGAATTVASLDDSADEVLPGMLRACADGAVSCPDRDRAVGLGIQPRPTIEVDEQLVLRWRATPVMSADEGFSLYWLARVE